MPLSNELIDRSESKCELCFSADNLAAYQVSPKTADIAANQVVLCKVCLEAVDEDTLDSNYWRCLNESMWSQVPAVQVMVYRLLDKLSHEGWALDLKGMLYLDDETLEWATDGGSVKVIHKDSNGHILKAGDTVTLIQDLNVKGASLVAKRGTAVRRIRLDPNNEAYIEGKVDGQHIVILTKYVKKQS